MDSSLKCWEKLPSCLLINIFSYLDLRDQRNAAFTCKAWLKAFNHPALWRSLNLEFSNVEVNTACCRGHMAYSVVSHCYKTLKHLTVTWYSLDCNPIEGERFTLMLSYFFDNLIQNSKLPQLKTLYLTAYTLLPDTHLISSEMVDSLVIAATRFLRTQNQLKKFWMLWNLCTFHQALLADAVSCSSAGSLRTLEIIPGKSTFPFNRYPSVFRMSLVRFSNLKKLVLSYENFAEDVLDSIVNQCQQLSRLILEVTGSYLNFVEGNPHIISAVKWEEAAQKLPDMKVNFVMSIPSIEFWPWQLDLFRRLIPSTVPLVGFISQESKFQNECIAYLLNFTESLKVLELYCKSEVISTVVSLISKCSQLKALKLVGQLPIGIIDSLEQLKMLHFTEHQIVYLLFDNLDWNEATQLILRRKKARYDLKWWLRIILRSESNQYMNALEDQLSRVI